MAAFTSHPRIDFALFEYILNVTICIQCGVFAFCHDAPKERFHALAIDKMHIYGIYTLDVILVTALFFLTQNKYGRYVDFNNLPHKIKFGI